MLDIAWRIEVAQRCFKDWESEQNKSLPMYHLQVERFFSRHIYSEIEDLREIESSQLGELMKRLLELAESEIERAYQATKQV